MHGFQDGYVHAHSDHTCTATMNCHLKTVAVLKILAASKVP